MAVNLADDKVLLVTVCVTAGSGFIILCFVILSVVFHCYPTLCHKRQTLGKFRGQLCSYRGGGGEALEGSMTAFQHSASAGADVFISVRKTRDGEIVVFPDKTMKRCCGVPWRVEDTLYKAHVGRSAKIALETSPSGTRVQGDLHDTTAFLPRYRPPFFLRFQKGFPTRGRCERIVTLSQIFEMFPKNSVFIDVKGNDVDQTLIDGIARLIVKHKREKITAWGSHNTKVFNALYHKNPFIPLWINRHRRSVLLVLYYLGLLPFTPIRESVFIVPMPSLVLDQQRGFQVGYLGGWKVWLFDKLLMNSGFIKHLKARGVPTYIYCLNYKHEFDRAFKLGARGVITDFPSMLKHYLVMVEEERKEAADREL